MAASHQAVVEKQLIIVCLTDDSYYGEHVSDIVAFSQELSYRVQGLDLLLVVCPESLSRCLQDGYASGTYFIVLEKPIDLWSRDFGLVIPDRQIKFKYNPKYLKKSDASWIDDQFLNFLSRFGITSTQSSIVLDGGNVVDNGKNKAIVSERLLSDNKGRTKDDLKRELERLFHYQVSLVPDPEDSTGHADGFVSFLDESSVLLAHFDDDEFYNDVKQVLLNDFPEITITKLPCTVPTSKWKGMDSAFGCYANILVTNNAVYVPTFGRPQEDRAAFNIVQNVTTKQVVGVDSSKLSRLGGNVRCMTWQVSSSHPVATCLMRSCTVVP